MPLAVEMQFETFPTEASSDVFGNELSDVDVWGDVVASDDDIDHDDAVFPRKGNSHTKVIDKALRITDGRPPAPPSSPHKPPRTPSAIPRKTMVVKASLRRSSGSEGDIFEAVFKQANDPGKILPPMTPRTRMRNLGLQSSNPKIVSPPPMCDEEVVISKPMTVAEKRRRRHECLSLRSKNAEPDREESPFPKLGIQIFEQSSTHTRTTAQMDSSCSSLSLCPSHFTSVSKGSCGDSGHSFDLKDLSQSQVSLGSSKRRNKSSSTDMDMNKADSEPRLNDVDDLQRHIMMALQHCHDSKSSTLKKGKRYDRDARVESISTEIPPAPRPPSSPRTPRSSRKSASELEAPGKESGVFRSESNILLDRKPDENHGDDEKSRRSANSAHSRSIRSSSSSRPRGPSSSMLSGSHPNKLRSESRLPIRSRSDCQGHAQRPRMVPSQAKPPRTRSASETSERRTIPVPTQRSPSPHISRNRSDELNRHTRSGSSTPRRKIKYVKEFDLQQSSSTSKFEF